MQMFLQVNQSAGFHSCAIRRYFNSSKHTLPVDYSTFDHMSPDDAPGQLRFVPCRSRFNLLTGRNRCWGMYDYGQIHPLPLPFGDASALRRCTRGGGCLGDLTQSARHRG